MPRIRILEALPLGCDDPLPILDDLMEGHRFKRIAKETYLRKISTDADDADDADDAYVLWYDDRPLITFHKNGMVLDLDEWTPPAAIARLNAVASIWGVYFEPRGGGPGKSGLYMCEPGGASIKATSDLFIPYVVEDREMSEDEDAAEVSTYA